MFEDKTLNISVFDGIATVKKKGRRKIFSPALSNKI